MPYLTGGNVGAADEGGFFSRLLDFVNPFDGLEIPKVAGLMGDLGVGAVKGLIGSVGTMLKDKFLSIFGSDDTASATEGAISGGVGSGVERWRGMLLQALGILGLPASLADTTLRRMNQESGGNARAINNWDINARNGVASRGRLQVIPPTFRAHALDGYDQDIFDPLSNILASMRYALSRYGSLPKAYNRKGGYSRGSAPEDFAGLTPTLFDGGGWMDDTMLGVHKLATPDAVIPAAEMAVIRQAATRPAGPAGFVGPVTLQADDGTYLGVFRAVAGDVASQVLTDSANDMADQLLSRTGV
ncbi:lytic transglycosylase domain-containing protein [Pseudokineococcus sp. 1T1Z-3]|uniref:lytic transglycosylase domain-containing protein n=1 Tax=Pseudokineococcus sp. 1T1Z-3 TaxID=3132745 RepID=UPI00309C75D4